jgi:hypothetical protein
VAADGSYWCVRLSNHAADVWLLTQTHKPSQ